MGDRVPFALLCYMFQRPQGSTHESAEPTGFGVEDFGVRV